MVAPPVHDLDGAFQSMVVSEASTSPGGVLARRAIAAEAAHEEPATVGAVDPPVGERELLRLGECQPRPRSPSARRRAARGRWPRSRPPRPRGRSGRRRLAAGRLRRVRSRRHDRRRVALRPLRQPLAAHLVLRVPQLVPAVARLRDVSLAGLAVFAVVYGLDYVATVPPTVKLTAGAFGREPGPSVVGWIFAAHQLGVGAMAYATASAAARWAPTSPTSSPPMSCARRPRRPRRRSR